MDSGHIVSGPGGVKIPGKSRKYSGFPPYSAYNIDMFESQEHVSAPLDGFTGYGDDSGREAVEPG